MNFMEALDRENRITSTENGALAYSSTGYSNLLDLYAVAGALRSRPESVVGKFNKAFSEDALLATKLMFYSRDVRGGLGERETFRLMLKELALKNPEVVIHNLHNIPFYGRYDDLFVLFGTRCEKAMVDLVFNQLYADIEGALNNNSISLLAKWMPSANTSSKKTKEMANKLIKALHLTPRLYRKNLSFLRTYLNVVEGKMSAKAWDEIKYEQVPARAMMKYRKAFHTRDGERYREYLGQVESGVKEIKAGTLYPYDIVEKLMHGRTGDKTLELQWESLPNYIEGENNVLVMADVSGSMYGRPMATSVGLALYFAERNKGLFHNKFMTFSGNPQLVDVYGRNLYEKLNNIQRSEWGMNTNLNRAFEMVLSAAIRNDLPQSEMPKAIVVISDMEIDACGDRNWDFYQNMKNRYLANGYQIPNIIFWNVDSRKDTFLVDKNRVGVQLVSGQSASTFKNVLDCIGMSPYESMLKVLNGERYSQITL